MWGPGWAIRTMFKLIEKKSFLWSSHMPEWLVYTCGATHAVESRLNPTPLSFDFSAPTPTLPGTHSLSDGRLGDRLSRRPLKPRSKKADKVHILLIPRYVEARIMFSNSCFRSALLHPLRFSTLLDSTCRSATHALQVAFSGIKWHCILYAMPLF